MAIKVKAGVGGGGPPKEQPEAGNHEARIAAVIDLGDHEEFFQQQSVGIKHKIYIVFELTDEQDDAGNNKIMSRDYVLSGHEKSGLYKLLVAALGPMPEAGHDLDKLLACPVMVNVGVNDKGYANVGEVTAVMEKKKAKVAPLDNVPFYWDADKGVPYVDCDWVPWVFDRAAGKRVKVSEMIAAGFAEAKPAGKAPAAESAEV